MLPMAVLLIVDLFLNGFFTPAPVCAPGNYKVLLDTTKGPVVIAVHREWAPRAADRFYELVTSGYYDEAAIFRIRKGTWAQFGEVESGMPAADAWYAEYGEAAGGGIRAGRQAPVFEGGNAYLKANFPLLDYIRRATIVR